MLLLDWRFLPVFDALDPASAYAGHYDLVLVSTSLLIAILAAFVALSISGRIVAAASQRARLAWATAGAISMGGGIWSMHFIGMLAFSLPCGVAYEPVGTVLSMIPGMLASGIALDAISKSGEPDLKRLTVSAVLMGAGIGAMHYSGMAAMQPEALLRYSPWLVLISILVAIVLAFVSLTIRFRFHHAQAPDLPATVIAATIMGCAVAGMHYTAMQAAVFFPLPDAAVHSMALPPTLLALLIAIFTVLIGSSTLVATFAGRQNELAGSLRAEVARRRRTEEDLVRARELAEAASRAKTQFVATMSHEIRTPMNGVLGMTNLLAATSLSDRQRRLVDNLQRSGRALLGTINDILDFSKIEAGRFDLFEVEFDPREVVAEVSDLFSEPSAGKGLEFVYFVAEDVPAHLIGDPVRLRQVLINLVGNAIKYTDSGEILVEVVLAETTMEHVTLALSVEDTGIGIAPEQRARVFESFYQADLAMTRARSGSGLGLTIAKHLVELMAGDITVESEIGRGSRFRFTVRLKRSLRETDPPRSRRHIAQPLHVLLTDANAVSARIMSLYLTSWRLDVVVAPTAAKAETKWNMAHAAGRPFDAAIVDVKGLGEAGIALARKIRADGRGQRAEIVALVALDSFEDETAAAELGAFAILTKPARPSELFNCLASLATGARQSQVMPFFMRRAARAQRPQFDARVLLVEDNAVNQEVAVGMLEAMSCKVITTANGQTAIQRFSREAFDLVLMDCEMPVMDGFAAARRIREIESQPRPGDDKAARPRTPIVAVTAHAMSTVHEKCLRAGMDDFLVKPFDDQQLAEALRRWLPARERHSEPVEGTGGAAAPIDPAAIDKIRAIKGDGSAALLQRVVSTFAATAPPLAAEIRAQARADGVDAVWRAAHSLKSSASAIGARQLAERCAAIEALARDDGALPAREQLDALDADLAAAMQSLKELT
jgi:signal transduction histidine kinase/CheY-like chemotaxis protein/HPt (histidine-containing phosphotransfer) domain-containing protein